jgi:hypothetical protein
LAPLRMPDHGRDRVLLDATRRQSTTKSHLTAKSWSLSGMIEGLGWSEKRDAKSRDAWHSGHHRGMMNNNWGRGAQIPKSIILARQKMTRYPATHCWTADRVRICRMRVVLALTWRLGLLELTWQVEKVNSERGTERMTQRGKIVPRTYHKRLRTAITQSQGHPTPSTSRYDSAHASLYRRHRTGQPHTRVVQSRCDSQRHLLMVQPHLWVAQSWCALHRHLLTVQSHLRVAQ